MDQITIKLNRLRDLVDTYDLICTSKNCKLAEYQQAESDIYKIMNEIEIELSIKYDGITESN